MAVACLGSELPPAIQRRQFRDPIRDLVKREPSRRPPLESRTESVCEMGAWLRFPSSYPRPILVVPEVADSRPLPAGRTAALHQRTSSSANAPESGNLASPRRRGDWQPGPPVRKGYVVRF